MGHYIGSRPRCFLSLHYVRSLPWRKCYQESNTTIWTGTRLLLWCHPSTQVQQTCLSQTMRRSNCLRCLHITWLLSHGGELRNITLSPITKHTRPYRIYIRMIKCSIRWEQVMWGRNSRYFIERLGCRVSCVILVSCVMLVSMIGCMPARYNEKKNVIESRSQELLYTPEGGIWSPHSGLNSQRQFSSIPCELLTWSALHFFYANLEAIPRWDFTVMNGRPRIHSS